MKFHEGRFEEAVIGLLEKQGYTYVDGGTKVRNKDEVLLPLLSSGKLKVPEALLEVAEVLSKTEG